MLFEVPMSGLRQCNRTELWELGRVKYTWQQVYASIAFYVANPVGPATVDELQTGLDACRAIIMAVDFNNPPQPYYKTNQNSILNPFSGTPDKPGPFPPPPLLETVSGEDSNDGRGFHWLVTSNGPNDAEGNFEMQMFDPSHPADFFGGNLGTIGRGPVAYAQVSTSGGFAQVSMTRVRILGKGPICVSLVDFDFDTQFGAGGTSVRSCGLFGGQIFNPPNTVSGLIDPLPTVITQRYRTFRIWASNPRSIPCTDCHCP